MSSLNISKVNCNNNVTEKALILTGLKLHSANQIQSFQSCLLFSLAPTSEVLVNLLELFTNFNLLNRFILIYTQTKMLGGN